MGKVPKDTKSMRMMGSEPYQYVGAFDVNDQMIAWRDSNIWPKGDERDWQYPDWRIQR